MNGNDGPRTYGLIGDPVGHSLSPVLMADAFARLGVEAVYDAWRVPPAALEDMLRDLADRGVAGVNVTYPHKTAVLAALVDRSADVDAVGAANVLTRDGDGRFRGDNTDAGGVALALDDLLAWSADGRRVVVLGAGGAARAAAHGLLTAGAAGVALLARDPERAAGAVAGLRRAHPDADLDLLNLGADAAAARLAAAELVVQATPVGLDDPDAVPLILPAAAPDAVGFELNYGPRPTAFVRAWFAADRPCLDGRDLLAAQAHLALRLWLGRAPDLADMRRAIAVEKEAP